MRDLILPVSLFPILAVTTEEASFWERMAERWGIGLVGLGLFLALSWITVKREEKLQKARDEKDQAQQKERVDLLTINNQLNEKILKQAESHSARMEQLVKDQTKAANDHATEMRNLTRKMKRPCVLPFEIDDTQPS